MSRRGEHRRVAALVEPIEGWLTHREGVELYELARRCSALGVIVEIGSWHGRSTVWLAHGSLAGSGSKVFAVDPHTGSSEHRALSGDVWTYDDFRRNIEDAGVGGHVVPLVETSARAAAAFEEKAGLVFIDGAHDYASVRADWELWSPYLVDGGVLAFHDTRQAPWPDGEPRRAMLDAFLGEGEFRCVRFADSLTYAQKTSRRSWGIRMRNALMLRVGRPAYERAEVLRGRATGFVRWHLMPGGPRRRSAVAEQPGDGHEGESPGA